MRSRLRSIISRQSEPNIFKNPLSSLYKLFEEYTFLMIDYGLLRNVIIIIIIIYMREVSLEL